MTAMPVAMSIGAAFCVAEPKWACDAAQHLVIGALPASSSAVSPKRRMAASAASINVAPHAL